MSIQIVIKDSPVAVNKGLSFVVVDVIHILKYVPYNI